MVCKKVDTYGAYHGDLLIVNGSSAFIEDGSVTELNYCGLQLHGLVHG
jgi:hypothetical protein